jgi:branched-chain amino acid aminotransferase
MRKRVLELTTLNSNYLVQETVLSQEILLQADEVFLTNAIAGVRWVKECGNKIYKSTMSGKIFALLH